MVADGGELRIENLRLRNNVFDGLQFGHIEPGFRRHGQVQVGGSQPALLVAGDGAAHIAFAPVVSGQRQVPIAEHAVQSLQVIQRRPRTGQHVPAVVTEHVLLEFKRFAGGRHELPHPGRFGRGHCLRVESAFHKGQQGQFGRHAAQLQFFNNVDLVFARALGHAVEVIRAAGVPGFAVAHLVGIQIGNRKTGADAVPDFGGRLERGNLAAAGLQRGHRRLQLGFGLGGCRRAVHTQRQGPHHGRLPAGA